MSIITQEQAFSLIPKRKQNSSKYDYGRLLAVCGSTFYRGAAYLSCVSALRMGTGIVTLASIEKVIASVSAKLCECTFIPLRESKNGTIEGCASDYIFQLSRNYNSTLLGCGLSIDDDTRTIVKKVIENAQCQLVIDADGLNIASEFPEIFKKAYIPPIITPHFSEMARLCKKTRAEIEATPEKTALDFAKKYSCYVVLKSHITYIASPDGKIAVNNSVGNAGLARGGSGDVLAGMISSLCAQSLSPFDACICGVYLHGLSADRCAKRLSMQTMLPSDILYDLCEIFKENE